MHQELINTTRIVSFSIICYLSYMFHLIHFTHVIYSQVEVQRIKMWKGHESSNVNVMLKQYNNNEKVKEIKKNHLKSNHKG